MPGLSQIKKLCTDLISLGNEPEIRAARGEQPATLKIPDTIEDTNDSEDFKFGMPTLSEDELAQAEAAAKEKEKAASDLSDITGDSSDDEDAAIAIAQPKLPDVSDLLSTAAADIDLDDLDLSDFEDTPLPQKKETVKEEPEEIPIEDLGLDALLAPTKKAQETPEAKTDTNTDSIPKTPDAVPEKKDISSINQSEDFNFTANDTQDNFEELNDALGDSDFNFEGSGIDLNSELPSELNEAPLPQEKTSSENFDFNMPEEDLTFTPSGTPSKDDPFGGDFGNLTSSADAVTGSNTDFNATEESGPVEKFDTSAIEDMDFSSSDSSTDDFGDVDSDFNLGNIDSSSNDDDLFNIPGFSDTETADFSKKAKVETPDFTGAKKGDGKLKNTFTDSEYKRFLENLNTYPLNVRIAVEDLVVRNEFTDDAVFAILEKVLRKVPARQLAGDLEKMLDISLDVPRDYERRSAAEYAEYKKSLEYQLKNKIIPAAILTAFAAVMIFCIGFLTFTFVIKPSMATSLYKKGYKLISKNEYELSKTTFINAVSIQPKKKWFYKYAQAYWTHRQYDRSAKFYNWTLKQFDHDKQAGMEWALMEMQDLYNYEEAERILKREVLDYHINDPEAILLLGDTYLEWGSELDSSKLDLAKEQYELVYSFDADKNANLYLSRMMRYYIRTDNLAQVLTYKEHFFPLKKKGLEGKDWTELSGYLFDKRYGTLKPSEEKLRFQIEDVRAMLEKAVKYDSENPVALYNMGRYFSQTSNENGAKQLLSSAINSFENQTVRNKRDTYKFINTYRLLGESYARTREYLLAENNYALGISLFENENESSGFASDQNVGKLYEDMGEINYFISGDMDEALRNYEEAINNKDDNSTVRYRVGYIQYQKENYPAALASFIISSETRSTDTHLLLSLANTLAMRRDNHAAQGYYEKLISELNKEFENHQLILPQVREDQYDLVDTYMKANNNLGVTLHRIAETNGNSSLNAKAIVALSESLRAWDSLTRNQETMVRLEGSNLAEQNIKYITVPGTAYEPEIYTQIPRLLADEKGLE